MDTSGTGKSSLRVQRLRAEYLVSSEHPSPERVKARLDETAVKNLAEALSFAISRWFSNADSSIWLVRRLDLELDVNAAWNQEQLAQCWAAQIVRTLGMTLQGSGDGQDVLRFDNSAAYLARFLIDLAEGCAWSKWYYQPFDGLRLLPASAALRTAIGNESAIGYVALLQLPSNALEKVLRVLTAQDARRVLESIADGASSGDEIGCFVALWKAWEGAGLGRLEAVEEWRNALRLYLAAGRNDAKLSGPTLRAASLALLRFTRCLTTTSASETEKLLAALTSGDLSTLYIAAGAGDAEILRPLIRCPPEWVKAVGEALVARYSGKAVHEPAAATDHRHTPFGGIFLLLPFIDALPLEEATGDWPDPKDMTAVALVRFLILVKYCGQVRAQRISFDPLVRDLMGIDPSFSPQALAKWQTRISQAKVETFLEKMTAWQRETGAVRGQRLVLACIRRPGSPVAVLLDSARGVWLFAGGYHPRRPDCLVARLRKWLCDINPEAETVLSDGVFVDALYSEFPDIQIEERLSQSVTRMAEKDKAIAEILVRMDKLPDDFAYLCLPKSFRISRSLDLALSVGAQGIMRAFSWHLPGFAKSSLPYLYDNFLDFSGSVADESGRHVVRLGKPPLNLVLNITGMAHKTYGLSWLDGRPLALFQEG